MKAVIGIKRLQGIKRAAVLGHMSVERVCQAMTRCLGSGSIALALMTILANAQVKRMPCAQGAPNVAQRIQGHGNAKLDLLLKHATCTHILHNWSWYVGR